MALNIKNPEVERLAAEVASMTGESRTEAVRRALDGFRRFGRGRHPAALNFGDCMTSAVARLTGEPLLCVGDDFPRTDLSLVRPGAPSDPECHPTRSTQGAP